MKHIAHIKMDHTERQPAADHCRNTARYASRALEGAALGRAAYLAGLVQDLGKYTGKPETVALFKKLLHIE